MKQRDIYRGTSLYKNNKRYVLKELSYIYDCSHCEYVFTTLDNAAAVTTRNIHLMTVHPELHIPVIVDDAHQIIMDEFDKLRKRVEKIEVK